MKSSFWPNLGLSVAVGNVAARGHVDVLQPDPAIEPDADMARLAVRLPVEPVVLAHRHLRGDGDAMVHRLAADEEVVVAEPPEQPFRELGVADLGFLQAEDVGRFLGQELLDDLGCGRGSN